MKSAHFDVEPDGFYGAYWKSEQPSDCALIAMLGYDADTAKAIQRFKTACGMSGDLSCSLTWSLTKVF